MVFLPRDAASREACRTKVADTLAAEGLDAPRLAPRPHRPRRASATPRASSQPVIEQAFVARPDGLGAGPDEDLDFDRRLYVARRLIEKAVSRSALPGRDDFYIASMSCRTIVYKGMLNASQLLTFYPDLHDERFESAARPRPLAGSRPTPSRRGTGRTRTATSATTARSTRCAGT